jgi:hypothetical protein
VAEFLAWLAESGYRAPDGTTGERIAGTRPDLIYREVKVAVFVDRPGEPYGDGRDIDAEDALSDIGWTPLRVPAGEWAAAVKKYPSVFGEHRGGAG